MSCISPVSSQSSDLAFDLSDGTCIQMSYVSFDNATLDYILVSWVCTVR